jgi:hypothetical protein
MKKRILTLSLLLVAAISFSFANNTEGIDKNVIVSFNKDFTSAHEVKWESNSKFIKVSFTIDKQAMYAYYTPAGELLAVTRYMSPEHLPISQLTSLRKNYSGYWVSDLFELKTDSETAYYITIENANSKLILKSVNSSSWEVYSREKKQ